MTTPASDYLCPRCGAPVPGVDINPSTGLALCRACGHVGDADTLPVPMSRLQDSPHITIDDHAVSGTRLTYRRKEWTGLIPIIFSIGWNGGISAFLSDAGGFLTFANGWAGILIGGGVCLFMLPFVLIGIGLPFLGLFLLFGKTVIELDRGQGKLYRGIGPVGWTRRFTITEGKPAQLVKKTDSEDSTSYRISIPRQGKKDFHFSWPHGDIDSASLICSWLNQKSR